MAEENKTRVAFRMEKSLRKDLESFLADPDEKLSHLVRNILKDWVKKNSYKKTK